MVWECSVAFERKVMVHFRDATVESDVEFCRNGGCSWLCTEYVPCVLGLVIAKQPFFLFIVFLCF